jgi:iron complex outermembrane recepter protein
MGNFYNMCITTPVSALQAGPFNATNGLCGPLGVGTWNSQTNSFRGTGFGGGIPALAGNGAVGVPNSVLQGLLAAYPAVAPYVHLGPNGVGSVVYPGATPRIYWNLANTQTGNIDATYSDGPSFARYTAYGLALTLDWAIRNDMHLKSITGWREITWDIGTDLDGEPESMQEVTDEQAQRQISEEVQLTGNTLSNRLDYAVGLYFFSESGYVHDFVPFDTSYLWIYDYANNIVTNSYAGYLHLDYKITNDWGLTLGGRYSKEKKDFLGGQGDLNGFNYKASGCLDPYASAHSFIPAVPVGPNCQQALGFPDPSNPLRYFPNEWDHQSWDVFTPTVGTQYHFTPDLMAYFSWSKGFKSGGWTTRLSNPILDPSKARFNPEYDQTYELGLKSEWLDHHLQANVAVFESKYDGIQLNVQEGPSPVYQNAGNATIKGAELELQTVFTNGLSFGLAAGYIDAYYTYLNPCLVYNNCEPAQGAQKSVFGVFTYDSQLPKTPKYKIAVSPQYDARLPDSSILRFVLDYTYTASLFNNAPNTPLLERPETHMLNASIHWLLADQKYEVAVGGTNLTDDRYLIIGSTNPAAGEITGTYNAPREWYASLRVKFQ